GAIEVDARDGRRAPDRDEEVAPRDRLAPRDDLDSVARGRDLRRLGAHADRDALPLQDPLDLRGDVRVLARGDARAPLDHRHLAPEATEHLRELEADVAPAED